MSGFTPSDPPPNASPESLRMTLRLRCSDMVLLQRSGGGLIESIAPRRTRGPGLPGPLVLNCVSRSGADLEPGEPGHGESGILQHLADHELVVARVVLLEQGDLLEEGTDAALD